MDKDGDGDGGRREDYPFMRLIRSKYCVRRTVNLIGVFMETSFPRMSKGTDYCCSIKIVDKTSPSHGLPVNFFNEDVGQLPHVVSAGDIIQLSQVKLELHNKEIYAVCKKSFSGFALFEGKQSATYVPYQRSTHFRSADHDKNFIKELRNWSASIHYEASLTEMNDAAVLLNVIKVGVGLNVICKVLHVCEVGDGSCFAFVWNGTDTPSTAIKGRLEEEFKKPFPLQLEPFTLSRDVLCAFPSVGTVLRVKIAQKTKEFDLRYLKTGRWMIFVNINCEIDFGLWHGLLNTSTKLRFLSDDDSLIIGSERNYDVRFSSKWGRMPQSFLPCCPRLTENDYEDVPLVTLMDILIHAEVTSKFRCVVRVVAVCPWQVKFFRNPKGIFRIRLTLEDPTARIHAYLYAEDAEKFFGSNTSNEVLEKMRNKLLGLAASEDGDVQSAERNPPWLDCCIKSYYQDENDKWGTRRYQIFATKVVTY